MMYGAFAQQRGTDPRDHWNSEKAGQTPPVAAGTPERVHVEPVQPVRLEPVVPDEDVQADRQILLTFYESEEPESATEAKVISHWLAGAMLGGPVRVLNRGCDSGRQDHPQLPEEGHESGRRGGLARNDVHGL